MNLSAYRIVKAPRRIALILVALCYLLSHGVYATGVMPAPLSQGGFALCHQNNDTRQLLSLGQLNEASNSKYSSAEAQSQYLASYINPHQNHQNHQNHQDRHGHLGHQTNHNNHNDQTDHSKDHSSVGQNHHSSAIAAETGCDIGVWLDLGVIQPSPSDNQLVITLSVQNVSRYVSPRFPSLARATFRSRAPPVFRNLKQTTIY